MGKKSSACEEHVLRVSWSPSASHPSPSAFKEHVLRASRCPSLDPHAACLARPFARLNPARCLSRPPLCPPQTPHAACLARPSPPFARLSPPFARLTPRSPPFSVSRTASSCAQG